MVVGDDKVSGDSGAADSRLLLQCQARRRMLLLIDAAVAAAAVGVM